jgi:hypothetical protein
MQNCGGLVQLKDWSICVLVQCEEDLELQLVLSAGRYEG